MRRYPPPLDRLPYPVAESIIGLGGGAAPAPVLGFTRAALPDQFPSRSSTWSIPASGTIILLGTVTAIGSDKGTILRNYSATRGLIFRFNSSSQLECIYRRSDADQLSLTHTFAGGLGSSRRWLAWGPDGGSGTDIELGHGSGSTTDTIGLGIGTGNPGGSDASILDQAGSANRAVAGSGLLVVVLSERLTGVQVNAISAAELLARGTLLTAAQPDHAAGETVTAIVESGSAPGTWSAVNGPTTGTHNAMTVAEVTA